MMMNNKMYKCKVCVNKLGADGPCFLIALDIDGDVKPNTCPFATGPAVEPKWKEVKK